MMVGAFPQYPEEGTTEQASLDWCCGSTRRDPCPQGNPDRCGNACLRCHQRLRRLNTSPDLARSHSRSATRAGAHAGARHRQLRAHRQGARHGPRSRVLPRARSLRGGPVVIEHLRDLLNADIAPAVRIHGLVGASADLVSLSYTAAALQGRPRAFRRGVPRPASQPCGIAARAARSLDELFD
jgi:hypothetical protein